MDAFNAALQFTLAYEGGYVNDPADPGGATNKGVTQATYTAYRRSKGQGRRDVRFISREEVCAIYRERYWDACRCSLMPAPLAAVVFDTAVNGGPGRGIQFLQEALGYLQVDNAWGPATEERLAEVIREGKAGKVALKIADRRFRWRYGIVATRPLSAKFLKGWLNRDRALKALVQKLIAS